MATDNQWKDKYLNALDKTEASEKRLKDVEETLRLTVSRLTLAGSGSDEQLDEQLGELKKLTRKATNLPSVRALLDDISLTIKRLDLELAANKPQRLPPHQLLALVLERVQLPREFEKKAKALKNKLGKKRAALELEKHLSEFVSLISDAITSISNVSERYTLNRSNTIDAQNTQVVDELSELIRKKFKQNKELASTCANLQSAETQKEISKALSELVRLLPGQVPEQIPGEQTQEYLGSETKAESFTTASSSPRERVWEKESETATSNQISTEEQFSALLDKLSLPEGLSGQVETLQLKLSDGLSENDWPALLSGVADLIAAMRSEVEREKSELQAFLFQITSELQWIDSSLINAEQQRAVSVQSGEQFNTNMQSSLSDLQTSVETETNLDNLRQLISQRMNKINTHLKEYRDAESERQEEISAELKSLRSRVQTMESETTLLNTKLAAEREQARTDTLTGINNRVAYEQRLSEEYERWTQGKIGLSIIVCDVDHFKKLNDTLGHQAGDKALQSIATVLKQNVRKTDLLARYGGEEFVVLISHETHKRRVDDQDTEDNTTAKIAEKIRLEVEQAEFKSKGERIPVTISCGYANFQPGDDIESAFSRADKNLYRAKELGRNRIVG